MIDVMEADAAGGAALASMREVTRDYTPQEDACPTFRGLAELERDMHVHWENNTRHWPTGRRQEWQGEAGKLVLPVAVWLTFTQD